MSLFLVSTPSSSSSSPLLINPNTYSNYKLHSHPHKTAYSIYFSVLSSKHPSSSTRLFCSSNYNFSGDQGGEPPSKKPPPIKPTDKETQNDAESDNAPHNSIEAIVDELEEKAKSLFRRKPKQPPTDKVAQNDAESDDAPSSPIDGLVDEWGEKAEPESDPLTKLSDSDPPKDEDEWGRVEVGVDVAEEYGVPLGKNGSAGVDDNNRLWELKRSLVDTVYGTNFGFGASNVVRGEALELVAQLEAANPTSAPLEAPQILDGNWVLLYTAFSELFPLLAAGTTPLLKVEKISQSINSSNLTIENSATYSSPLATFSFSASASFEVRSSSRIQVEFKEGTLKPPEIKSRVDLPENVEIFGQKVNLSPVQQSLNPLQDVVAGIARSVSGLPPLKIPIPGDRTKSWLLITYLDKDLRISRGDGGVFVLAKEGSPLLDQ